MEQQSEDNYQLKTPNEELIVSVGPTIYSNKLERKNFNEVINVIRSGAKAKAIIEEIRQIKDKKERKKAKENNLNYFNMALYKNDIRRNENLITAKHLLFDYDTLTQERLKEKIEELKQDQTVFVFFLSPSGNGLKIIYRLDKEITDYERFSQIYKHYAAKFKIDLGANSDPTSGVSWPCFLSYDPDIYVNYNAEPLSTDITFKESKRTKRKEMIDNIKGVAEGSRNTAAVSLTAMLKGKGIDKEFALEFLSGWNMKNDPPLEEKELSAVIDSIYKNENDQTAYSEIVEREGCYYKKIQSRRLTSFLIEAKELLVLQDRDCLKCNVSTQQGNIYEDVLIDNTDWHSKQRFLRAVGHSDCVFLGSDNELQLLCDYVISNVKVKKEGIKIIGLVNENIWAVKSINIDKNGVMENPVIVPYEKGKDAFYNKIKYGMLDNNQQLDLAKGFYENIFKVNLPEKILPWIAWIFATPFKPIIDKTGDGFPILFVHGGQGSGKTSTASLIMRLCGYSISDTFSCTMKSFPMLKLLSSTNAVPVILDEFKKSDMKDDQVDSLLRYIRKSYSGEVESKGRPDQTTDDYHLTSPLSVMGEWNINQPAIMERVLLIRLTDVVKKETSMQDAFNRLKALPLEGFMPGYIQFCLNQNFGELYSEAKSEIDDYAADKNVAPRIKNNLSILLLGLKLFTLYAKQNGIDLLQTDIVKILDEQLIEITGSLKRYRKISS